MGSPLTFDFWILNLHNNNLHRLGQTVFETSPLVFPVITFILRIQEFGEDFIIILLKGKEKRKEM